MIARSSSVRCFGSPTSLKVIKANMRAAFGRSWPPGNGQEIALVELHDVCVSAGEQTTQLGACLVSSRARRTRSRQTAVAKAGLGASTGARLDADPRLPSQRRAQLARYRSDPLAECWGSEIAPLCFDFSGRCPRCKPHAWDPLLGLCRGPTRAGPAIQSSRHQISGNASTEMRISGRPPLARRIWAIPSALSRFAIAPATPVW